MNAQTEWTEVNNRFMASTIKWVRLRLQQLISFQEAEREIEVESKTSWFSRDRIEASDDSTAELIDEQLAAALHDVDRLALHDPPPALLLLADRLGLSRFDCSLLALCAGMELDTLIAGLCARAQDDPNKPYPTFALAFALFDDPDWGTISPHAALRHWRLLEINRSGSQPLTTAALKADERIVNYLKGLNYLDDRITPLVDPVQVETRESHSPLETLPMSQQRHIDSIIDQVTGSNGMEHAPVIELKGRESASKRMVAGRVASSLGLKLYRMDMKSLPGQVDEFETFTRLWQRESILLPLAMYIDTNNQAELEKTPLNRFLERNSGLVFLDVEDTKSVFVPRRFSVEVTKPTPAEQEQLWKNHLDVKDDQPQRLAEQFSFTQSEIVQLSGYFEPKTASAEEPVAGVPAKDKNLWQACRVAARIDMDQLAQRIDAKATWQQLVLPPEQKSLLQQITDQVGYRNRVYEDWGFRQQMNRGLGINALFAGESGTGKTMAAEVIANVLELDLYRIDLSAVVSKYIGETEKNLRRLFDAAEDSGAIIFFDEADALFGKRSEVKDSHDRYANIEINYLLQRMETYRGLAILATNMKSALDKAFVRRLRFIVDFPFPDVEQRTEIWQKIFPPGSPLEEDFDHRRLARLNLTGGNIHNVAINAAFLAAQENSPITMPLVLSAAKTEFHKLERPARESDFVWKNSLEAVQ